VKANAKVAENLFRKATGDGREAVIAAIFWMKTRAQWKETSVTELAGPPQKMTITWLSPSSKAPEQREPVKGREGEAGLRVIDGDLALPAPAQLLSGR